MKDVRRQMEEDEQLSVLMASLRGSNLSAADFAESGVQMRLVDVSRDSAADGDSLPLEYNPALIEEVCAVLRGRRQGCWAASLWLQRCAGAHNMR